MEDKKIKKYLVIYLADTDIHIKAFKYGYDGEITDDVRYKEVKNIVEKANSKEEVYHKYEYETILNIIELND